MKYVCQRSTGDEGYCKIGKHGSGSIIVTQNKKITIDRTSYRLAGSVNNDLDSDQLTAGGLVFATHEASPYQSGAENASKAFPAPHQNNRSITK